MRPYLLMLPFALGCGPATDPEPSPYGSGTPVGTPSGTPGGSTTGSTTGTPTPTIPEFDCATVQLQPSAWAELDQPRGYHDVAFTLDGFIVGNDDWNQNLVMTDGYGDVGYFLEDVGQVQGMEWLPNGNLAVATDSSGAILSVDPVTSNFSVLVPGVWAYGLIMGPDGKLWSANNSTVQRHDVSTGASETLVASVANGSPRVINFNRDFTKLYIGTNFGNGNIYQVELDANFDPVGGPTVFATGVGGGNYHDGMGVDICGYIYVPDYDTSALYRISPDGTVETVYDQDITKYGHGLQWGNGVGPWRTDAIYLPLPYGNNRVLEIVIGVPRDFDGDILNAPQP